MAKILSVSALKTQFSDTTISNLDNKLCPSYTTLANALPNDDYSIVRIGGGGANLGRAVRAYYSDNVKKLIGSNEVTSSKTVTIVSATTTTLSSSSGNSGPTITYTYNGAYPNDILVTSGPNGWTYSYSRSSTGGTVTITHYTANGTNNNIWQSIRITSKDVPYQKGGSISFYQPSANIIGTWSLLMPFPTSYTGVTTCGDILPGVWGYFVPQDVHDNSQKYYLGTDFSLNYYDPVAGLSEIGTFDTLSVLVVPGYIYQETVREPYYYIGDDTPHYRDVVYTRATHPLMAFAELQPIDQNINKRPRVSCESTSSNSNPKLNISLFYHGGSDFDPEHWNGGSPGDMILLQTYECEGFWGNPCAGYCNERMYMIYIDPEIAAQSASGCPYYYGGVERTLWIYLWQGTRPFYNETNNALHKWLKFTFEESPYY